MKPIGQLINTEKAKLLHQLFPSEIPDFLTFLEGMSENIKEQQEQQRTRWDNGLFSFDFWLQLVEQAEQVMKKYGKKLSGSPRLFADQLFDGYLAMFIVHCLQVYTTTRVHPNPKFTIAVNLLFL